MTDITTSYKSADSFGRASFEQLDTYVQANLLSGSEPPLEPALGIKLPLNCSYAQFSVVGMNGTDELVMAKASARATLTVGSGNAALNFSAVDKGAKGNLISVQVLAAAGSAAITVVGTDIVVTPATGTPSATAVAALIAASPEASALVTVTAGGTGSGNPGVAAAANLAGGDSGVQALGVLAHAASLGATGTANGQTWLSGCFNPDVLVWDASFDTDAKKEAAFIGAPTPTRIIVRKRAA